MSQQTDRIDELTHSILSSYRYGVVGRKATDDNFTSSHLSKVY